MKKIHNFSPGPSILPEEVFKKASEAVLNLNNSGLSILEISHRSKDFIEIELKTRNLIKELLNLNNDYDVLFLTGGASTAFFTTVQNLVEENETISYLETGSWAEKAHKAAKDFCKVHIAASSSDKNFNYIPKKFTIVPDAKFLHITSNNTIFGTQYHEYPTVNVPLIADMSSDFLHKKIDIKPFGLIYAGAQKNLGPAGVTLVIVRKDLLGRVKRKIPKTFDFKVAAENDSMYNTPPVFNIYVCMLTLEWIIKQGGLEKIYEMNKNKAKILYDEIDRNSMFKGTAEKEDRSLMNVCFVMNKPEFEKEFLEITKKENIQNITGHRSVGGFRASIYNAMPIDSVKVLVELMKKFEKDKN